jgi:ABC-type antimicrobial peptide transport system permease subunit
VLAQVLRAGMSLVSMGVALGILLTLWGAGLLDGMLFGVSSRDPITYVGVAIGIAAVALAATLLPARRAATVDPLRALRSE